MKKRSLTPMVTLLALAALSCAMQMVAYAADAPKERDVAKKDDAAKERVVVMYFHRTQRCPTCMKMGNYTEEAVKKGFVKELKSARVSLHFIDFQDEKNAAFTKAFEITGPTLIVAKGKGDEVAEYKNLQEMWTKVRDKDAFLEYVQTNVKSYLK